MKNASASDLILTFTGAISREECRALIDVSETAGYKAAPIHGKLEGPFGFRVRDGRNNHRAAVEDAALTAALWQRLKRFIPERIAGKEVVGLNERLRFYRYEAGQDFGAHTDGYYLRASGERSLLTLMIYLNEDFDGGETCFLASERSIAPQTGTLLIFSHALWHSGKRVLSGKKYILRTDVMYQGEVLRTSLSAED